MRVFFPGFNSDLGCSDHKWRQFKFGCLETQIFNTQRPAPPSGGMDDPTKGIASRQDRPRLVIRIDHTYFKTSAFQCLEEQFTTCTVTKIAWDDGKTDVLLSREHDNNIYKIQQTHWYSTTYREISMSTASCCLFCCLTTLQLTFQTSQNVKSWNSKFLHVQKAVVQIASASEICRFQLSVETNTYIRNAQIFWEN